MATLDRETWQPCSVHEVTLSFLRSEWAKWSLISAYWDRGLVGDSADIASPIENNIRAQMIWTVRSPLLQWIPADTKWFMVQHLRRNHFRELRAINHVAWNSLDDMNELEKVALRTTQECRETEDEWSPILWAHDRGGPFTIIEGNHRMTGLARSATNLKIALIAYVGLSESRCAVACGIVRIRRSKWSCGAMRSGGQSAAASTALKQARLEGRIFPCVANRRGLQNSKVGFFRCGCFIE
jgi:hypothetical protein